MRRTKALSFLLAAIAAIVVVGLYIGCTEKIVGSKASSNVRIQLAAPEGLRGMLDSTGYRLIVRNTGSVLLKAELFLNPATGMVESKETFNIPGGLTCTFTVEAYDSVLVNDVRRDTTIMSGDTTISIEGGKYYDLAINLRPTFALMLLTPPWVVKKVGDTFTVDVVLYNVPNVAGVTFRVDYDSVLRIDSVVPTANTNHDIFEALPTTPHQRNLSMAIATSAYRGTPLFKSDTSGVMVAIHFSVVRVPNGSVTDIQMFPTSFYGPNGQIFPSLLNDDPAFAGLFGCFVQISP